MRGWSHLPRSQGLRAGPEPGAAASGAGEPHRQWWHFPESQVLLVGGTGTKTPGISSTSLFMVPGTTHGLCTCLTHSSNLDFLICLL